MDTRLSPEPSGKLGELQPGSRVRHRSRPDVGEGVLLMLDDDDYCDVQFARCRFSWIPVASLQSVEDFERERLLEEQEARRKLELARAEEDRLRLELRTQRTLLSNLSAGARPSPSELLWLSKRPVEERLQLFAAHAASIDCILDEVEATLQDAVSDRRLTKSLQDFWTALKPSIGQERLLPFAPAAWRDAHWRTVKFKRLSLAAKLQVLQEEESVPRPAQRADLFRDLAQQHKTNSDFWHRAMSASLGCRLELFAALDSDSLRSRIDKVGEVLQEAAGSRPGSSTAALLERFWHNHQLLAERGNLLFPLAPRHVQRAVLRRYFARFLDALEHLFAHNKDRSGDWPAELVYSEIETEDRELASIWSSRTLDEHILARMISARAAEKVAKWFYLHLGFDVLDVAVHQLSGKSAAWKTHDILVDWSLAIDVKNARMPVNNKAFYVEHTVPRFKRDRTGADVTIAGVVSPYLSMRYLNNPEDIKFEVIDVRYLGETSYDRISQTCSQFADATFVIADPGDGGFLPPWHFDFPTEWYDEFDRTSDLVRHCQMPSETELHIIYNEAGAIFPLPVCIASGIPLPEWLLDSMPVWKREFVVRLQSFCKPRPRLAQIFFAVLVDFLGKLKIQVADVYRPVDYFSALYHDVEEDVRASRRPLGIEDPLETVRTLIESLGKLWTKRDNINLDRFNEFRLSGGGILQGRENRQDSWQTILSYCGGWIEGKGRCGNAPLILGVEEQCDRCHRLICYQCGYCSDPCDKVRRSNAAGPLPNLDQSFEDLRDI